MDHAGIHAALVRDSAGLVGEAALANRRVLERTRNQPRLHPVWMVLPSHTHELPPPAEMVAQMCAEGVAAAWLSYGAFGIPLEPWCLDDLLGALAAARVPLFLDPLDPRDGGRDDATDWRGVVRLCQAFPELPVVVTESRIYKSQRALWAALAACPNLHIDISALWLHHCIEMLCREFGARRLILGTQLPRRNPAVPMMQLNYSDIPPEDLAGIAGGNLRALITWHGKEQSVPDVSFPPATDALHRMARDRAGLSGESLYDCHGHVGYRNQRHVCAEEPAALVREMDRLGVRHCFVFTWIGHGEVTIGNDIAFEAAARFPERLSGFTAINPGHGEGEARRELERGLAHGMKGVKLVTPIHRYPYDGPVIEVCCRFAHEHRQFILNHVWGPPAVMRRWLEKYPGACYLTGHSEGNFADLVRAFPNLYICSCPFLDWGQTEEYVRRYGADRILFGSDLMDLPVAWGLAPIFYARIPEAEKRLMLGENLKRLLRTYGGRGAGQ